MHVFNHNRCTSSLLEKPKTSCLNMRFPSISTQLVASFKLPVYLHIVGYSGSFGLSSFIEEAEVVLSQFIA